ncbi:hypothetical protein DFH09DRAFT_272441 [Mycena vulgaris]|nr:hypothetical protein DFH09DRAFT_272441 [Mycena vulgaris]
MMRTQCARWMPSPLPSSSTTMQRSRSRRRAPAALGCNSSPWSGDGGQARGGGRARAGTRTWGTWKGGAGMGGLATAARARKATGVMLRHEWYRSLAIHIYTLIFLSATSSPPPPPYLHPLPFFLPVLSSPPLSFIVVRTLVSTILLIYILPSSSTPYPPPLSPPPTPPRPSPLSHPSYFSSPVFYLPFPFRRRCFLARITSASGAYRALAHFPSSRSQLQPNLSELPGLEGCTAGASFPSPPALVVAIVLAVVDDDVPYPPSEFSSADSPRAGPAYPSPPTASSFKQSSSSRSTRPPPSPPSPPFSISTSLRRTRTPARRMATARPLARAWIRVVSIARIAWQGARIAHKARVGIGLSMGTRAAG